GPRPPRRAARGRGGGGPGGRGGRGAPARGAGPGAPDAGGERGRGAAGGGRAARPGDADRPGAGRDPRPPRRYPGEGLRAGTRRARQLSRQRGDDGGRPVVGVRNSECTVRRRATAAPPSSLSTAAAEPADRVTRSL